MTKKRWIFVIIILLIGVMGSAFYLWWHSQASTSVVTYGAQDASVLGSQTTLTDWQTAYFTTKIATSLRQLTSSETPDKPILGSYLLASTSLRNTDQVGVTIGNLNNYALDELSAVRLRAVQAGEYTKATRSFAPAGALVFSRVSSYETSIFWQHGSMYAAVVVSGSSSRRAELEQNLSDIVSNWQWK